MKKRLYLLLLLVALTLLFGCQKDNTYLLPEYNLALSANHSPEKCSADFSGGSQQDDVHYDKIPQVAQIFDADQQGEFLGLFYDNAIAKQSAYDFKIYPALYLMNLNENRYPSAISSIDGTKMAEPESGYQVIDAALNPSWLAWVETNKNIWQIYCLNRSNNSKVLLAKGNIQQKSEYDLPGISLYQNSLVYNDNRQNVSKVMRVDLISLQQAEIFAQENGAIIGKPVISDKRIVWSKSDNLNAVNQVYAYNVSDKKVKLISDSSTNSVYPFLWQEYVAWISYPIGAGKEKTDKSLVLFNLAQAKIEFTATISKELAFYKPTISNGLIIWPDKTDPGTAMAGIQDMPSSFFQLYYYSLLNRKTGSFHGITTGINNLTFENLRLLDQYLIWQPSSTIVPPPAGAQAYTGIYLLPVPVNDQ
jgi:hypothetical protein